jgi:hypothetical protein
MYGIYSYFHSFINFHMFIIESYRSFFMNFPYVLIPAIEIAAFQGMFFKTSRMDTESFGRPWRPMGSLNSIRDVLSALGLSWNGANYPKWMVYNGNSYSFRDDLGVALFSKNICWDCIWSCFLGSEHLLRGYLEH